MEKRSEQKKPGARDSKANVVGPQAGDEAAWASTGELWMGVWRSGASGESQGSTGTHTEVGKHEEGAGIYAGVGRGKMRPLPLSRSWLPCSETSPLHALVFSLLCMLIN